MAQYDTQSLYDFMIQTPESGLRKMMIDRPHVTDVHFNLLLKIVRGCTAETFRQHLENKDFPRLRTGPAEEKIKEKFWDTCIAMLLERGLLQPAVAGKFEKTAA